MPIGSDEKTVVELIDTGNEIVQESPLLREVVISSCFLGERKLLPHLFQPDSEQSLSNEH